MSKSPDQHTVPRALIHTKILDAAADAPDASMEAIAAEVPSATTELVERVLEQYGDPAADNDTGVQSQPDGAADDAAVEQTMPAADEVEPSPDESKADVDEGGPSDGVDGLAPESAAPDEGSEPSSDYDEPSSAQPTATTESDDHATDTDAAPMAPDTHVPDADELSPKQREVLEAIADRPDATQREIADEIGVSAPTVSNRANSIEGFEWAERREFVAAAFERNGEPDEQESTNQELAETAEMATNDTELTAAIERLTTRVEALEDRLDELDEIDRGPAFGADHELAHKVAHACLESDTISEEEELRVLKALLE